MRFVLSQYADVYGKNPDKSSYGDPAPVVLRMLDLLPPESTVLDLGGGDMRHAIPFAKHGHRVTVVDLSPEGLSKGLKLAAAEGCEARIRPVFADLGIWTIDRDYDAMVCTVTLQYLTSDRAVRLLQEMKRRTVLGGFHALTVFTETGARSRLDREGEDVRDVFYPEDGWLADFYQYSGKWRIVSYDAARGNLMGRFEGDGVTPATSVVERILAQKLA